jgi:hypothetical protein
LTIDDLIAFVNAFSNGEGCPGPGDAGGMVGFGAPTRPLHDLHVVFTWS